MLGVHYTFMISFLEGQKFTIEDRTFDLDYVDKGDITEMLPESDTLQPEI